MNKFFSMVFERESTYSGPSEYEEHRKEEAARIKKELVGQIKSGAGKKTGKKAAIPISLDRKKAENRLRDDAQELAENKNNLSEERLAREQKMLDEENEELKKTRFSERPVMVYDKGVAPRERSARGAEQREAISEGAEEHREEKSGKKVPENMFSPDYQEPRKSRKQM